MMLDEDGYKVTMIPSDFVFTNSKAVFVEYLDIIRAPYRQMLEVFSHKEYDENSAFDFRSLAGKSTDELNDYYYGRYHRNFIHDFFKPGCSLDVDVMDKILDNLIETYPFLLQASPELRFVTTVKALMFDGLMTKKVYIWYPYDNPEIRMDIHKLFEDNVHVEFVHGTLEEALKDVDKDATYVFSDIMNIDELKRLGRLEYSAVLIPGEYNYNMNEDDELLLDIIEYQKETTFKFYQFYASMIVDLDTNTAENVGLSL